MNDLEAEKNIRTRNLFGNKAAIPDVTTRRKPDRVFGGDCTELDLGTAKYSFWPFGSGNTPGETIAYVAEAKAAWTGNFISNELNAS